MDKLVNRRTEGIPQKPMLEDARLEGKVTHPLSSWENDKRIPEQFRSSEMWWQAGQWSVSKLGATQVVDNT